MKDEIYTIPVNDGFQEDCECAFCAMQRKLEKDTLDFVLSPSYMEEDVRGETNEKGFCRSHMELLYRRDNALGVALILQSQFDHKRKQVEALTSAAPEKKKLFGKKKDDADPILTYVRQQQNSCYICDRIDSVMERYYGAFFILWKKDQGFQKKVLESKGFCFQHFLRLFQAAGEHLSGTELSSFLEKIRQLEKENNDRVAEDINWFTLKFDYRYQNQPWKNSKDAIPRTIEKINSHQVTK